MANCRGKGGCVSGSSPYNRPSEDLIPSSVGMCRYHAEDALRWKVLVENRLSGWVESLTKDLICFILG